MSGEHEELRGQVALITGASSGIGMAMARTLAGRGVRLALAARRKERLDQLVQEIGDQGVEGLAIRCDVRDGNAVQEMVRQTEERFGGLDILIPNAGLGYRSPIVDGDVERWKVMLDTNVYGTLLTLKYGVPLLLKRGRGDVFLMSSVAGHIVGNGGAGYSATKFAVNAIGEALRQEVSRKDVRVTLLAPGAVISEFQEVASYPPSILENWLGGTPPLQPDDIAQAMLSILDLPRHVAVNQLIVRPTGQVAP